MAPLNYDIAIVGAGLVGSSLACVLSNSSYRVAIIDAQAPAKLNGDLADSSLTDGRSIALALSSKKLFQAIGVWQELADHATAIKKIHISDQGQFGATRLDSNRYGVESFGYLIPAELLITILNQCVNESQNIQRIQPCSVEDIQSTNDSITINTNSGVIHCKLLVSADGARSFVRNKLNIEAEEKDYGQTAIVGSIETDKGHANTAYERFTKQGPLALLPRVGNSCGYIWMNPSHIAQQHLQLSDEDFLHTLQQAFGYRLGHFSKLSSRFSYPLSLLISDKRVHQRVVFIGNAAQTLHPIAGQGLNLALRDIAELHESLFAGTNSLDDVEDTLQRYEAKRQPDIHKTIQFTDRLNFIFNADYPLLSKSRGLGLALLGAIPVLEEQIVNQNLGASGSNASLLRGEAIQA